MQVESTYRMPAFRESFRYLNEEEYERIEDALEAYLLLTIRLVFEDVAAGRLALTASDAPSSMKNGPVGPETINPIL